MDASTANTTRTSKADRQRVELLKDLHRPLEEHWAGNKDGLDAMGSDYIYKHHITRMEGIYNSEDAIGVDNTAPAGPANVSPMTQLYGTGGMLRGDVEETAIKSKREGGWDPYHTLVERVNPCMERRSALSERPPSGALNRNRQQRQGHDSPARSLSPLANMPTQQQQQQQQQQGYGRFFEPNTEWKQQSHGSGSPSRQPRKESSSNRSSSRSNNSARHRCDDQHMTREQLLLAGMYNLRPQQRHTYQAFVRMLLEHDTTDQLRIMEDAFRDAQVESLLTNFSGT